MSNYYSTLGVERSASADEIKRAYRKMAGQHHPDRGGDKEKFQEIQAAYDTLSDPQKRAAYDNPNPFQQRGGHNNGFPGGFSFSFGTGGFNFNDMFEMFGQRGGPNQEFQRRTMRMSLWIKLQDVVVGGRRAVSIAGVNGTSIVEIDIPTGVNDGDNVRYPGISPDGSDLIIQFRVHPDPVWSRQDLNLTVEHPVSIWDLILGNEISLTDLTGVTLVFNIPPRTQPKSTFRLRGKGIADQHGRVGDINIRVNPKIPDYIDPELIAAIEKYRK